MPDLKLGNTDITTVKLGSTQVDKVYLGTNLIWSSWAPSDPDAAAYINVMNSLPGVNLTQTEKQAIDNLFIRMKGNDPAYPNFGNNGIYAATKALYPYVGSNLEAFKYNAVFPVAATQQTDGAGYPTSPGYQYIAGGVTVDSLYGARGNGVNGIILTNLNWAEGYAFNLSPTSLSMGAVYKTTTTTRKDFGEYNAAVNMSGIWLRTAPTVMSRQGCLEGSAISGPNLVINGRGHWMLHRSGTDKRVYYQGVQQTYPAGTDRGGETGTFGGLTTWTFLGLNFTYFNGVGGFATMAQRAASSVNFAGSNDTLMFSYIMTGYSSTLIPAWNQMVEAFCVETGKKTW